MKISDDLPLTLFYKKYSIGKETIKQKQAFTSKIAGLPHEPDVEVPSIDISIEAITIHDTNTLKDAIEMIQRVKIQNHQLMPRSESLDFDIGIQLLCYLSKVAGYEIDEPEEIDRLVKSFETLLSEKPIKRGKKKMTKKGAVITAMSQMREDLNVKFVFEPITPELISDCKEFVEHRVIKCAVDNDVEFDELNVVVDSAETSLIITINDGTEMQHCTKITSGKERKKDDVPNNNRKD